MLGFSNSKVFLAALTIVILKFKMNIVCSKVSHLSLINGAYKKMTRKIKTSGRNLERGLHTMTSVRLSKILRKNTES